MRTGLILSILLISACSSGGSEPGQPAPNVQPAPWSMAPLPSSAVPTVYLTEWRNAENRATCAPIAFASAAIDRNATARRANFAGGWGVAYDLPGQRSAFGIAGAGVAASEPSAHQWPYQRTWSDGSSAGYGPEGGTGPNQLAYLRIAGQGCLYNVWSRLGREHLEGLLDAIRLVDTPE